MLRIEPVEIDGACGGVALRLTGEVHGPWVGELRRVAYTALSSGAQLTLDLGEVRFADRCGGALLADLAERNVSLVNCSSFIAELLRTRG